MGHYYSQVLSQGRILVTVTLKPINRDNWRVVMNLKVAENQNHFIANNAISLAQAVYSKTAKFPLGIYDGDTAIGLIMYGIENYKGRDVFSIDRLMVAKDHQRKGYGRAAMLVLLEMLDTVEVQLELQMIL